MEVRQAKDVAVADFERWELLRQRIYATEQEWAHVVCTGQAQTRARRLQAKIVTLRSQAENVFSRAMAALE
jgi:hypothetical protein